MLTTNLKLAEKYNYLDPKFKKAFEFLRTADLAALPLGNTPIDGDEVFANVQAYTTLPDADAPFESHEKYFDLQFVVSGEERFGYAPRDLCKPAMAYDADRDLVFYEEPAESGCIILKAGDFAIVPPEDAHAPRRQTAAGACAVKKIVREAAMYGNANNNRLFLLSRICKPFFCAPTDSNVSVGLFKTVVPLLL